jgi:3-oxoacyl-[acyl-carrier protein] reductase
VLEEIKKNGGDGQVLHGDISNSNDVQKMVAEVREKTGHIDVLINNAGSVLYRSLKDTTEDEFQNIFNINTKGVFLMMKYALPLIRQGGRIINLSSSVTQLSLPTYGAYSASKAAVEQLTRVFAREIGKDTGITVNCVAPGPTDTELFREGKTEEQIARLVAQTSLGRLGKTEDIADVVTFLVSNAAKWITGQTLRVNGGFV